MPSLTRDIVAVAFQDFQILDVTGPLEDAVRRRLEESTEGLDRIAAETGLGTADSLRRAFARALGVTPSRYRARFSAKGARS